VSDTERAADRVSDPLPTIVAGIAFQNPILLAAGTAAYGREIAGVIHLDRLGGLTTKAVSLEPRAGAKAPRVWDVAGGMINAVGLANPGIDAVLATELPWLASNLRHARTIVNVVGSVVEDFVAVVERLESAPVVAALELNASCPNTDAGGLEFCADTRVLSRLVAAARAVTKRPLFVKLSPVLPDIAGSAACAMDAGASGLTLVNSLPGLAIDVERRRPVLGMGAGGVSGSVLLPVGVLATWKVHRAVATAPLIGVGGVTSASDALQYLMAGASLVGIGTAALRDPRVPERVVDDLRIWCEQSGVRSLSEVVGSLDWHS
jgi:dihydroorotate dehydrogenase (NAD+) catalytic subunit